MDDEERLGLRETCQFQGHFGAAVRLFIDAFAADPNLAGDLTANCLPE